MSACELCPIGHFAASSTECWECEAGTYAASEGLSQCTPCPYPTSSKSGDVTCSICKEGFYLKDASALPDDVFQNPTEHCKPWESALSRAFYSVSSVPGVSDGSRSCLRMLRCV